MVADAPAHTGRNTARRVVPLFRPYRAQVAAVVGLIVLTSTIGIVNPLLIQAVFNKALFVPGGPNLHLLYILVAIMAVVPIVNGAIGILQTYETTRVGQQVMRDLRDRLYSHLQTLSLAFFTSTKTGEIQSRLANDVGGVQSVVTTTASTHPGQRRHLRLQHRRHDHHQLAADHRGGHHRAGVLLADQDGRRAAPPGVALDPGVAGGDERHQRGNPVGVRGAAGQGVRQPGCATSPATSEENQRLADLEVRQQMIGQGFYAVVQSFLSITPAAIYLIAGLLLAHGTAISAGTIVAFTTLQTRLYFPIGQLLQVSVELRSSLALFDRIFEYLDVVPDIVDAPDAVDLPVTSRRRPGGPPGRLLPLPRRPSRRAARASASPPNPAISWPWSGRAAPARPRSAT